MTARKRKRGIPTPPANYIELRIPLAGIKPETPMATVNDLVRPLVLKAILHHLHGFPSEIVPDEGAVECDYFAIGRSQDRYAGRSRINVRYRLARPPAKSNARQRFSNYSRSRHLYAWIGRGTLGGIALFVRDQLIRT